MQIIQKMMQRKSIVTKLNIICRKTRDKETIASLMRALTMQVIMKILKLKQQVTATTREKFHVPPENLRLS